MDTQNLLEDAISKLVEEFLHEPYKFFTEADAVARFHQLLDEKPQLSRIYQTKDNHNVSLAHREFPTMFRFNANNPCKKLDDGKRGHYDTVILNPEFIQAHHTRIVVNRDIKFSEKRDAKIIPFNAVIEFKLGDSAWSKGKAQGVKKALGKLRLSKDDAELRYLVVLQRQIYGLTDNGYITATSEATKKHYDGISIIFATSRLGENNEPQILHFGPWLSGQ